MQAVRFAGLVLSAWGTPRRLVLREQGYLSCVVQSCGYAVHGCADGVIEIGVGI